MVTDLLQGCVISSLWNEQQSEAESNLRLEQSYCCWRRLLRAPWAARRSNQSALKEINPEYSLEGLMLKLKLQYFGHLMQRADIGKSSDAGKERRQEEKRMIEDEMVGWHHRLYGQEFEEAPGGGEAPGVLQSVGSQRGGRNLVTEQQPLLLGSWQNRRNQLNRENIVCASGFIFSSYSSSWDVAII